MASGYGSWVGGDDYRAYVSITMTSETATYAEFKVQSWMQTGAGGYASNLGDHIKGRARIWDKVTNGYRNGSYVSLGTFGSNSWLTSSTVPFNGSNSSGGNTWQVQKTHDAQTVYGYTQIVADGSASVYANTSSTAQATLTLAAKTSYAVTYNGNKPSAATGTVSNVPDAQTKWHGEDLTLATAVPTLTNYIFKGWATSNTATTATYQPGETFTTDGSAVNLYAVWELALVLPTISNVKLYRTATGNTSTPVATENAEGTYGYLEFAWAVDSATNGNTTSSKHNIVVVTTDGNTTWTANTVQVTGSLENGLIRGTFKTNLKNAGSLLTVSAGTTYTVRATITDSKGAAATTVQTLSQSTFHIDAYASSSVKSIAFGRQASETRSEIGFGEIFTPVFDNAATWRSQMGTNNASNLSSGTVPRARIENTAWAYLNSTTASSANWVRWRMVAGVVYVEVYYASGAGMTAKTAKSFGTIPEGYRPTKTTQNAAFLGSSNNNLSEIWVETDGTIKGIAVTAASAFYGNLCYPL